MEKKRSLLPNFSQLSIFCLPSEVQRLEILPQILERKWKMEHWWLIKAGKPNLFHGASKKYSSLIIDAIVHYHSHQPKKIGLGHWKFWIDSYGPLEILHNLTLTWLEGKSLMFNRKIASSFVRLYSLSMSIGLCFIASHWKNWCISTRPP